MARVIRKQLTIGLGPEVYKALEEDSKLLGQSMSAYICHLIMEKNMALNYSKLLRSMTEDQIKEELGKMKN
jgi:hypothetical protein